MENGTISYIQSLREDLGIFRVTPDGGVPDFKAGQFSLSTKLVHTIFR